MPSRQPPPPDASPPPASAVFSHLPSHARHHLPPSAVASATASAGAAALILVAFALFVWLRRGRKRAPAAPTTHPAPALRRLSYQQLRRATSNFAAGSKLGQGGFGPVFRGALPISGQPVAVKAMDAAGSLQGEREFHNELALASHLSVATPHILLPFAYSLSASAHPRRRRMMLVYHLMPNGSLQDALLGARTCPDLVARWPRRLAVARDVAAALHYLHFVAHPPVVHGDVKPSNVLLDAHLRARLSDFGLARIKSEEEENGELHSGGALGDSGVVIGIPGHDDVSVAAESTTTVAVNDGATKSAEDDEGLATASLAEAASASGCDKTSVGSGFTGRSCNAGGAAASGAARTSDWWWRQDNGSGSGSGVKDYVMEWIRSEIKKERPKTDWIAGASTTTNTTASAEKRKPKRRAREWWREEYAEELTKKQKRRALAKSKSDAGAIAGMQWWERDCDAEEKGQSRWRMMKSWSRRSNNGNGNGSGGIDWWIDGVRRSSRDWASTEFVPKSGGAVSSTPSMRGTVCYVAPEYGGGGPLSEKCDIYSFGVLLLVLISGRRPLQVTASPMSEFEKASLISWARHLAHVGRLLDLVDSALLDVNRDQALLCITVALLCIQRSPARRPSSEEVLEMLSGEGEPPHLPVEFSPSPPGGFPLRSRKKGR
ncbi:receptor-like serine/threonine-protein kinase At2g45590 [Lolium perenne]|uniref:receptor-like serine/threonine-protein kinase At2g45590 n=1 Tax=Lolium perenne TaxID=4522 RepID=UPI0021F5923F|nr:receptor-like serine/threonine-protein kinase At2g45590 [Lolium perenne]